MILMSYKDRLSKAERKVFKGMDQDTLDSLGIKKNKKGKLVQEQATWKGDTFEDFMRDAGAQRQYYSKARPGGPVNASEFFNRDPDDLDPSLVYANPGKASIVSTLTRAGISPDHFQQLARDSDISYVNSPSDLRQMIAQAASSRNASSADEALAPEPEPEPEPAPVTTAQDYVLSPTLQSALDFEKDYEAGLASGALNPFRDGYRAAADEVAKSFLSDYTSDLLDLSRRSMTA